MSVTHKAVYTCDICGGNLDERHIQTITVMEDYQDPVDYRLRESIVTYHAHAHCIGKTLQSLGHEFNKPKEPR